MLNVNDLVDGVKELSDYSLDQLSSSLQRMIRDEQKRRVTLPTAAYVCGECGWIIKCSGKNWGKWPNDGEFSVMLFHLTAVHKYRFECADAFSTIGSIKIISDEEIEKFNKIAIEHREMKEYAQLTEKEREERINSIKFEEDED
jgi:hypothetical protein